MRAATTEPLLDQVFIRLQKDRPDRIEIVDQEVPVTLLEKRAGNDQGSIFPDGPVQPAL